MPLPLFGWDRAERNKFATYENQWIAESLPQTARTKLSVVLAVVVERRRWPMSRSAAEEGYR